MKSPRIALVVAVARNGVIGRDGRLPWRMASDLAQFKAITTGKPIIMGRKTWESLPRRPLPGRLNIVLTRKTDFLAEGAAVAHSLDQAVEIARGTGASEICVIGGAEIFAELLPRTDRLYLSEVDLAPEGDVVFPPIRASEWQEISRQSFDRGPRDDAGFVLRVLDRVASGPQS
ncbi:MAG: dihydrofolate reductase [Hyphomicrobiales bacterium]